MFQITDGKTETLRDVHEFIDLINHPPGDLSDFFDPSEEIYIARAPGRLDVMGGIADYSGSMVLEMPIAEATLAALQKTAAKNLVIVSLSEGEKLRLTVPFNDLTENGLPISYEKARQYFSQKPVNQWAAYVAGVLVVLMHEKKQALSRGARILISSRIPLGKGVSSSAALEVATMKAVCAAYGIDLDPRETALYCQKVENLVVGAPCGVMDQMTSVCGEEDGLIGLLCQPAEILESIRVPDQIEFYGVDSGVRHAVAGADYGSVRIGAFMGYRMIAEAAGLKTEIKSDGRVKIEDPLWNGYLSNIRPSEFELSFAAHLPEKIKGRDFLAKYQGTTDAVTRVDPGRTYSVKIPSAHAVYEHFRVRSFAEILKSELNETKINLLGELMLQSHASYAACGLCENGTNRLVELVRENQSKKLYGAKITGGGSGGTVAILAAKNSSEMIRELVQIYEGETGLAAHVFKDSSPGANSFGFLKLTWQ